LKLKIEKSGPRVLVTGGNGFLGRAVCRILIEKGYQVRVIGRNSYPELEKMGILCFKGDIRNFAHIDKAAAGCFAVIHTAALPGIWGAYQEYYSINVMGTKNVVAACKKHGISVLVYTSTPSVVYHGGGIQGKSEKELTYPGEFQCHYAETKANAEQIVIKNTDTPVNGGKKLKTISLRPHLIWGPGDKNLIPRILEKAGRGKLKIIGTGDNLVDIVYIDNAAAAHVLALEKLMARPGDVNGKAYFITQQKPVNLWDFINKIIKNAGMDEVKTRMSFKSAFYSGFVLEKLYAFAGIKKEPPMTRFLAQQLAEDHYFDPGAAVKELGYKPHITIDQGLTRLAAWISSMPAVKGSL
jgi:nucleoside-diphosphate-sugar epimerase